MEYASPVWDPSSSDDIETLEKIQKRAARWTTHRFRRTSSINDILDSLDWPSLQSRRKKNRLEFFYKFHKGIVKVESNHLPAMKEKDEGRITTRSGHQQEYEESTHKRTYRQKAFFPRTVAEWNRLPEDTASAETLGLFKAKLSALI